MNKRIYFPRRYNLFVDDPATPPGGGSQPDFETILKRTEGGAIALAHQLFTETSTLRTQKAALETEIGQIKAKLPAEGAVVLTADEATLWGTIKGLNLKPEEIKQRLEGSSTAETELKKLKRRELLREASESPSDDPAVRFKASVLESVIGDQEIVWQDVTKDEQTRKVAHVKVKEGETEKLVTLDDYVKKHKADFVPALQAEQQEQGTRYPRQPVGGTPPGKDPVQERLNQRAKDRETRPNPLMPAAAQARS